LKDSAHKFCSPKTVDSAFELLKRSSFRSKFKLTEKDRQYIQDKGIETIKDHAFDFINSRRGLST